VNFKEALYKAESIIASRHIADARNEAELLLMHFLGIGRAELYTRLEELTSPSEAEGFWYLVQHRCHHEPTAYIMKQCQFYGIDFYIDSRALIPRPESELLVETALEFTSQCFPSGTPCSIADVGTGSGAIAIVVALHLPQAKIYASDISAAALEVARINCRQHGVEKQVHLLLGDMLQPLPEPVDIILANLPYVKDSELPQLCPEIRDFEPIIALAGGRDGLEKVRQLLPQAKQKLLPGGLILLEIGQGQGTTATALVRDYFTTSMIDLIPDLAGIDRVVRVQT
jgi:release factor glutamine methyltransferase